MIVTLKHLSQKKKTKQEEKLKIKAVAIEQFLSSAKIRAVSDAKNPAAPNWLSAVPLEQYNFVLKKK